MKMKVADLPKLKKAWEKAVKEKKTEFTFKGELWVTDYVKYLLQNFNFLKL